MRTRSAHGAQQVFQQKRKVFNTKDQRLDEDVPPRAERTVRRSHQSRDSYRRDRKWDLYVMPEISILTEYSRTTNVIYASSKSGRWNGRERHQPTEMYSLLQADGRLPALYP